MTKIDLITGFLGSGKTTFLIKYAKYLISQGLKIGILEYDYGAVNIDMMLLQELRGDMCELEMLSAACDRDCLRRRFRTKLIAMGMSGYDRVLVEPSGVFDMDEFFDILHDEPLDRWYEVGSIVTIVNAMLEDDLSPEADFLLASQAADCGKIVLSRTQMASAEDIENTKMHIKRAAEAIKCRRNFDKDYFEKNWDEFDDNDFTFLMNCGYRLSDYVKVIAGTAESEFDSVYFLESGLSIGEIEKKAAALFADETFGNVLRVKGCIFENDKWHQINAAKDQTLIQEMTTGQDVVIVIGSALNKEKIIDFVKNN